MASHSPFDTEANLGEATKVEAILSAATLPVAQLRRI